MKKLKNLFETDSFYVREWNINDSQKLFEIQSELGLSFTDIDAAQVKLIEWALVFGQTKMGVLPLFNNQNGDLMGYLSIKPSFFGQPKGLYFNVDSNLIKSVTLEQTTEALQGLFNYGFKVLGLTQIVSQVFVENKKSKQVVEQLGMSYLMQGKDSDRAFEVFHVTSQ